MKTENLLLVVAVIAVIVSVIGAGLTYDSVTTLRQWITGFATDAGTINLSVGSQALINFTTNNIDWGAGNVTEGMSQALLSTADGTNANGTWGSVSQGLVVENIGNQNVTLNVTFGKTADDFIGGTNPSYQYNITNSEADSCTANAGFNLDTWNESTTITTAVCDDFHYGQGEDEITIDIKLVIPQDSDTGALGDTVTLTYEAVT